MARLILITSPTRRELELGAITTIGRSIGNTLQFADGRLSKKHALIRRLPVGYVLFDLGSKNGTFVGGKKVGEMPLRDGDELRIGSQRFIFKADPADSADLRAIALDATVDPSLLEGALHRNFDADFAPAGVITDPNALARDYERLRIAHRIAQTIALEPDEGELLGKILKAVFDVIPAERGVALLADAEGRLEAYRLWRRRGGTDPIVLSTSVLEHVARSKSAIASANAGRDARFEGAASLIREGVRSVLCVPLVHDGQLLGAIYLDSTITSHAFDEKDLQILGSIAHQASILMSNARLARRLQEQAEKRTQLGRLLPPSVVDQVMRGELVVEKGGQLREVTVLFADVRGFTAMAERMPPQEVVDMLNEYFEIMVDVLFRHEGTIDKFVGDQIMGLFGAPVALDDAATKAVRCAVEMQTALSGLNAMRLRNERPPLEIGIGINTGPVVTGMIGSSLSMQYTAIGDTVNTASRLCGLAGPGQIVISQSTRAQLPEELGVDALPPAAVKGKREPLNVFRVITPDISGA